MSRIEPRAPGAGRPPLAPRLGPPTPPAPLIAAGGGRRLLLRMAAGIVLLVLIGAGATFALVHNEVARLVSALKKGSVVQVAPKVLAPTYKGGPETLLLVGNDERRRTTTAPVLPHSNEMLLVRIDPSQPTIAMLSIPRELWVPIHKPDGEVEENRINAAYQFGWENGGGTAGGTKLMVDTIKEVLGLSVNHVFIINFKKFEHAIEEMGCVYFPVDKRYYHNNQTEPEEQYMEINLQPGYQNLCGRQALTYVANRHESTSLVRDARDQRFVLEVKKEFGGKLFEEREKFEHIFAKNVETDLKGEEEVLNLLELLIQVQGRPVRQINFPVTLEATHDTATPEQIHEAVSRFLGGTRPISKARVDHALSTVKRHPAKSGLELSMTPTSPEALAHARSLAPDLPFPLEYPRIRSATAESEPDTIRLYKLHDPKGHPHPSYVIVVDHGLLGQYYDIEGTTWLHPPILNNPSQNVKVGGRIYSLYYTGQNITTIAWRERNAVYWIENTLSDSLSPRQMIEIAEETQPVDRTVAPAPLHRAKAAEAALKVPAASVTQASNDSRITVPVGIASLLGLLLLAGLLLRRRSQLRQLRGEIASVLQLEAQRPPR